MGARFRMITVFEGLDTGDHRHIRVGALTHRELPLTLMGMRVNPEMGGHGLATVAGRIDSLTRVDATGWTDGATAQPWGAVAGGPVWAWVGEGEFGDDEDGQWFEEAVGDGRLRGISADLAEMVAEEEITATDEDGWPTDWLMTVTSGMLAAATICNVPAFRGCNIEILPAAAEAAAEGGDAVVLPIAASSYTSEPLDAGRPWLPGFREVELSPITAAGGPVAPPAAWFADPALAGPTALQVDDDGRVYGHLALWGTEHTARPGVTPPRSATNYALFRTGAVRTDDGRDVAVGQITLGTGHADLRLASAPAAEHYDHTGSAVADVAAGEDAWGIYVAGACRPGLTDEQVRVLRASPLSGDWRAHGRGLELVAALAVNSPGFPVPRAIAASGAQLALVAAGAAPVEAHRQHDDDTARLTDAVTAGVLAALDRREQQQAAAQQAEAERVERARAAAAAMARIHAATHGPAVAAARERIAAALRNR